MCLPPPLCSKNLLNTPPNYGFFTTSYIVWKWVLILLFKFLLFPSFLLTQTGLTQGKNGISMIKRKGVNGKYPISHRKQRWSNVLSFLSLIIRSSINGLHFIMGWVPCLFQVSITPLITFAYFLPFLYLFSLKLIIIKWINAQIPFELSIYKLNIIIKIK